MTAAKNQTSDKVKGKKASGSTRATQIAASDLPRRTLEEVMRIPETLHSVYAGKSARLDELAKAMEVGPRSVNTKYLFWSADAYGIVTKEDAKSYSLSETGRKIVAPTYDGEEHEGRIKAILTPTILSKFYSDYNGHPIPSDQHLPNVLETKFDVPRDRVAEAAGIILANARYAGILEELSPDEPPRIRLSGVAAPEVSAEEGEEGVEDGATEAERTGDPDWDRTLFFITPIGEEGSEVRRHADMMLRHLIEPVARECALEVVRADRIERSGLITQQILEHLARARVCVADLSFGNPNAFYELAVRHMCRLPSVQVTRKADRIPFDVSQGRTIVVDTSDLYTIMDRFESARRELEEHIQHFLTAGAAAAKDDNPIAVYLPGLKVTMPK